MRNMRYEKERMKFSLRAVADALGVDATALPDAMITGWSVDSRTVEPGDLFFALRGPVNDGHAHVAEVFAKGAVAAVVEETHRRRWDSLLRVDDTLRALQELAALGAPGMAGRRGSGDRKRRENHDERCDRGDAGDGNSDGEDAGQPE